MIYLENYFDDCNGVIPQLVLSAMALQAGNIRANVYKNALTVDLSAANTFSFDGFFLTLQGILPLTESRYLISVPSLISRIGAMNSENLLVLNDLLGLPVAGFDPRPNLRPVVLPPAIDNLSAGVLVLEKRLAYLLLLQAKRNNLNILYNYLYYTRLAGELARYQNTKSAVIVNVPPSAVVVGNQAVYTGGYSYIGGWNYFYIEEHPLGRSTSITNICINNLFNTYPSLKRLLPNTAIDLETICDWLQIEMTKDDPIKLPDLDFNLLVDKIADKIAELRYQEPARNPLGTVMNENGEDVDGTISGTSTSGTDFVPVPQFAFSYAESESPLVDRPSADYSSLTNSSPTTDSLPPC
jgi:hypothetical protein